jgi:hypothetical protein
MCADGVRMTIAQETEEEINVDQVDDIKEEDEEEEGDNEVNIFKGTVTGERKYFFYSANVP